MEINASKSGFQKQESNDDNRKMMGKENEKRRKTLHFLEMGGNKIRIEKRRIDMKVKGGDEKEKEDNK